MKITVALLALTVLFAFAASQGRRGGRRRHTYDIEEGMPSKNVGPLTFTAGPNTRGDWGAGIKMPGVFDLGGHAGLLGESGAPHAGARIKVPGYGKKAEAKVRGRRGRPSAFITDWF